MWKGRVEIFFSGIWGTVSYNESYSNDVESDIACRQLGYNTYRKFSITVTNFESAGISMSKNCTPECL